MAAEHDTSEPGIQLTEHETRCLQAAYKDLFDQERRMIQTRPGPVESGWLR